MLEPRTTLNDLYQQAMQMGLQPKPRRRGFTCFCPAHDDRKTRSLSVAEGMDGRLLYHCFAGCTFAAVMAAWGVGGRVWGVGSGKAKGGAAFVGPTPDTPHPTPWTFYDYHDEDGVLLYQTVRGPYPDGAKMKQRRPGEVPGEWINNLNGVRRVLYRLPELLAADPTAPVFLVEGEKDVETLRALGLIATTNPMGASSWRAEYAASLVGRTVVICPDYDTPGMQRARQIEADLTAAGIAWGTVELPGIPVTAKHGVDVTDWLNEHGGTKERLMELVEEALAKRVGGSAEIIEITIPSINSINSALSDDANWPAPLAAEAFHGAVGEIVSAIAPHTEADPAALLLNLLVGAGSLLGRGPHAQVEGARHGVNLFGIVVGKSSKARKGTAWSHVKQVLSRVDPDWGQTQVQSGLASGEGLIHHVRDPREALVRDPKTGEARRECVDEGVSDKRLMVVEQEFGAVLQVMERDRNTLSALLKLAWDGAPLQTMAKNAGERATDAHVSISGHIVREELLKLLSETQALNGFGNRFLWFMARRVRELPHGGSEIDYDALAERLKGVGCGVSSVGSDKVKDGGALDFAGPHTPHPTPYTPLTWNADAREVWAAIYPQLSGEVSGLLGSLTARAEAYVLRLSVLYARLDGAAVIAVPHLLAACAVWDYAFASARHLFADHAADPVADQILRALRESPDGLTRTEISDELGRGRSSRRIDRALEALRDLAYCTREPSGARRTERWWAVTTPVIKKQESVLEMARQVATRRGERCESAEIIEITIAPVNSIISALSPAPPEAAPAPRLITDELAAPSPDPVLDPVPEVEEGDSNASFDLPAGEAWMDAASYDDPDVTESDGPSRFDDPDADDDEPLVPDADGRVRFIL